MARWGKRCYDCVHCKVITFRDRDKLAHWLSVNTTEKKARKILKAFDQLEKLTLYRCDVDEFGARINPPNKYKLGGCDMFELNC